MIASVIEWAAALIFIAVFLVCMFSVKWPCGAAQDHAPWRAEADQDTTSPEDAA